MASNEDTDWLTSPDAAPWLCLAADWTGEALSLAKRLRKHLSAERARLVLEQAELRRRAAGKFSLAAGMFFTPRGLEQATDEVVGRYKAARFPSGEPIADLCCGIGGDLMALAARGPVTGIERDPITAALAEANLRAADTFPPGEAWGEGTAPPLPLGESRGEGAVMNSTNARSRVIATDVTDFSIADFAAWHIDPDRRPTGRRTTRAELHEPAPAVVARLLGECPHAAVKLAPAAVLDMADVVPWREAELEWISRTRQCRQLVAWFGSLAAHPGRRRATVLAGDLAARGLELVIGSFVGSPDVELAIASTVGRFVFEPDAAVLAAHLTGALAAELPLKAVTGGVAYLTADETRSSPLLAAFEVLDVMAYRPKALKAWLGARQIGRLEVKKRGVDLDPDQVRRELNVPGDETATLLLCRIDGKATAILARRHTNGATPRHGTPKGGTP